MIVVDHHNRMRAIDEIVLTTQNLAPLHLEELPEITGICSGRSNPMHDKYIVEHYKGGDRIPPLYFLI